MKCLVYVMLDGTGEVSTVDSLIENAAEVCAGGTENGVATLGTFTREGRKSSETMRVAVVELDHGGDVAKRLETVLRAMLCASGLKGCEVRAWTNEDAVPVDSAET